jgi:hypothetical protein
MPELIVDFILDTKQVDEQGFLYYEEISLADPRDLLESMLRWKSCVFRSGYCFVKDGVIWNFPGNTRYNPRKVLCYIDDVDMAYLFLDNVLSQFEDRRPVRFPLVETVEVSLTVQEGGKLTMVGRRFDGEVVFPEIVVSVAGFFESLYNATAAFLSFARKFLEVSPGSRAGETYPAQKPPSRSMGGNR